MTQDTVVKGNNFQFTINNDNISRPLDPVLYKNFEYRVAEQLLMLVTLAHFQSGVNIQDANYIKGIEIIIEKLKKDLNFQDN